jgi:hypothetical protein
LRGYSRRDSKVFIRIFQEIARVVGRGHHLVLDEWKAAFRDLVGGFGRLLFSGEMVLRKPVKIGDKTLGWKLACPMGPIHIQ